MKVRSDKETPYITLIGTPRAVAQARAQVLAILALAPKAAAHARGAAAAERRPPQRSRCPARPSAR